MGAVGSVSHKRQHCIVAVASVAALSSIGIDLELDRVDPDELEIRRRVCRTASEQDQAQSLELITRSPGTLFLSAKESYFK
jgi:4'-phosphopantetheinyl transferase EntD